MKKVISFFALALGSVALAATTVSKAYVDKNDTETLEAARTYTDEQVVKFSTPPGYNAVSNAAMNAASRAELTDAVKDAGKVQSVNSQTGAVVITAADLSAVTHDENGYVGIGGDLGVGGNMTLSGSLALDGADGYITAKGITTENGFTVGDPDGENISLDEYGITFGGGGTTLVERDAISSSSVGALALTVSRTNVTEHFWATNNPHAVTAAQVGAYTTAETDAAISSAPFVRVNGANVTNMTISSSGAITTTTTNKNGKASTSTQYLYPCVYSSGTYYTDRELFWRSSSWGTNQWIQVNNGQIRFWNFTDDRSCNEFTDLIHGGFRYSNSDGDKFTILLPATNGVLLTDSVTNGLATAASVAQEAKEREDADAANAAAIAAEKQARESAGYLTAESDPAFAAWTNGTSIVAGYGSTNPFGGVVIGNHATGGGVVIGENVDSGPDSNVVIGKNAGSGYVGSIVIGCIGYWNDTYRTQAQGDGTFNISTADPAHFWFGAANVDADGNPITPRSLQSYLDERATTNDLADVKAMISATDVTFSNAVNAAARALVKSKLESLDKAKSSIGETIAALQSIYETETK